MSDGTSAPDLDGALRCAARGDVHEDASHYIEALVAEVKRLRTALEGLVKINAEDFTVGPDGKIDWSEFPVTFEYARVYRDALVALGREVSL